MGGHATPRGRATRSGLRFRVPECQKLQNDGLTRSGTGCFLAVPIRVVNNTLKKVLAIPIPIYLEKCIANTNTNTFLPRDAL